MKLKLVKKQDEAKGTKSFFFEPETPVSFEAGQYFYFTLPKLNYSDARGNTRHFTISLSPTEGKLIRFTTRLREESGFKKTLDELAVGSEITGEGPGGTFYMDKNTSGNHIFLAGGIGITPLRSMIKFALDTKLNVQITLIYSNSAIEEVTFKEELETWQKENSNLKVILSLARINEDLIRKNIEGITDPTFWISGPPGMVDGMEGLLISKLKISPTKIKLEKFTGY